jgi:hypothetical protein
MLLTKQLAEFFLILVVVLSELRRNGEKLEIFRLHLGVDPGSGWSSADGVLPIDSTTCEGTGFTHLRT